MSLRRTVELLPEIFRTDTNRKFLSATLDQLTQEPNLVRTQGYVGRRAGPGVDSNNNYVTEPNATRNNYQLDPGVVFLRPDTSQAQDVITYPGLLDALKLQGAAVAQSDRLMQSEYYAWDSFCDLDKFTNYSQYYWLENGPDSVDVFGTDVALTDDFVITRNESYVFSETAGQNPAISLVRGGNYTFELAQPGHAFWIQTAPGVAGTVPSSPNISSRAVAGVANNGTDVGSVVFNVPLKSDQDFFYSMPSVGTVDLITDLKFNQLNNVYVDDFLRQNPAGIDGITQLNDRTVVFVNTIADAQSGGWQITSQFDPLQRNNAFNSQLGSFDSTTYDQTDNIVDVATRYSVWQIRYVLDDSGNAYITLQSVRSVPELTKFSINFGTEYSSTQWYKTASGLFEQMPLLTAVLDTLWYQDSSNPEIFGRLLLVDPSDATAINIDDIVGAADYVSPNGVAFSNGLKIQFRGLVQPASYQNREFYVEGVGSGPGLLNRVGFVDGEAYFGPSHAHLGVRMTGAVHRSDFHQFIYDTVEESLLNMGQGGPAGSPLPAAGVPANLRSNGIKLIPVDDMIVPELADLSAPDYITINRASKSRSAWSRSNRWTHVDVIRATAAYNNQVVLVDNKLRGKRPILEFRSNINLYNSGTQAKQPVNVVDFSTTDAFSNIAGSAGYSTDGYRFVNGTRVVFAADTDPLVRNQIWQVELIDTADTGNLVISLTPADNSQALPGQSVVCISGTVQTGKTFWFDGVQWQQAQEKTRVNQPPLFDVYDSNGNSFGNNTIYPSTTFAGSRLFGYSDGAGTRGDNVLGFPLRYLNINNVGDILFENYFYTDTFLYVQDRIGQTQNISTGFAREYVDRVSFADLIGWQTAAATDVSRQVFVLDYAPTLTLDVAIDLDAAMNPLQLYVQGTFVDSDNYVFAVIGNTTEINLLVQYPADTKIEAQVISRQVSASAYYQVPLNLENNPLNQDSTSFTLGTIRTHYESIGQNLRSIVGPIVGANNTRDLGNINAFGSVIVQHSAPVTLTGTVLRQQQFEFFKSLQFNGQEYSKYKHRLLSQSAEGNYVNLTPTQVLDDILLDLSLGRSEISPFYWSDMLPFGNTYIENNYTYGFTSTPVFDTVQTYDFGRSNFLGLLVYVNGRLLTMNTEYTVAADTPTLEILTTLAVGDRISVREYETTYGNFVPNTPTKMGLYPAFKPELYLDTSYVQPRMVVRGHDGSVTVAFGDFRDQVLLEFETRIYNNLKIQSAAPLDAADVVPGQFRNTQYSPVEINNILSTDFLTWVGHNKLDYNTQVFDSNDPFTYNYSQSASRVSGQPSVGAWRGIYNYLYDTIYPDTRPWEMLGFSQEPAWWQREYGAAPYTSGNLVLWDDLASGTIRDPANPRVVAKYARPGLLTVLPVDSEGNLLSPLDSAIGNYDASSFRRSWRFGDQGPAENAWRTSSAWPFAVMRLLALTKPAEFFSVFVDRDRYGYNQNIQQYLWDGRYRLNATDIAPLYGNAVSRASYLNWIIDYNRQLGINSTDNLTQVLNNIDVRLCWRAAGFTDKSYLKIFTERSSPDNTNASEILPDESYQVLLYKNQPFERVTYSSVVVQRTADGWSVLGYDQQRPYFEVLQSRPAAGTQLLTSGSTQVRVATEFTSTVRQVPYGFVYTTVGAVSDFLVSYGAQLQQQGLIFENRENGYVLDWSQMAQEFLAWTQQGWSTGSLINLNPAATGISVEREQAVVDNIYAAGPENIILNQNRQPLGSTDLLIDRLDNVFRVRSVNDSTINYVNLQFTSYEHAVVLDNRSIFSDLIYQPVTGARQSRVLVSGWRTGNWTGILNAPGFVLNQDNIAEWSSARRYAKGEIVLFKNEFWTASTVIQPGANFEYNSWIKSDYDQIQKGLLPNAASQSAELVQAYSINSVNLEQEVDLFSYGLIGFRPRDYMQSLNLDDVSQVNLYQNFLKTKGTLKSAQLFAAADLGKEIAEYSITEYWAVLRSQYGATGNRNYIELLLDQATLLSDPSLVQIVLPQQASAADQTVLLQDVWKSSINLTSTNILPTTTVPVTDVGLPSAGYVNLDDVDITAFDLDSFDAADNLVSSVGVATTVWIANTNAQDWNVYSARKTPGKIITVADNLNNRAQVVFDQAHQLAVGDILIIKFFDAAVDGIYRVKAVPGLTSLLIDFQFAGQQTAINSNGVGFTLKTTRVAQAADIVNLPYAKQLTPGIKIWVDDNGQGQWQVLQKTDPFSIARPLSPTLPTTSAQYGASVAQGLSNLSALVGAPGYNLESAATAPGAVYTYVKTQQDVYEQNSIMQLGTSGTAGYGNAIAVGNQDWAVIGASESSSGRGYAVVIFRSPGSNVFEQWQLLAIAPDDAVTSADKFGFSVVMSQNERWLYVGAPGGNSVYAYARVDVETQTVQYVGNGVDNQFNIDSHIVFDTTDQLVVSLNGEFQTAGVDYSIVGANIAFATAPISGSLLTISRRVAESFEGDGSTVLFSVDGLYAATETAAVSVYADGVLQRPEIDYTVSGPDLTFTTAPADKVRVSVRTGTYWKLVNQITSPAGNDAVNFGHSIVTTTDGRKLIVADPGSRNVDLAQATVGQVYVYDRAVQNFQVVNSDITTYTTIENAVLPVAVSLNKEFLVNAAGSIAGTYTVSGNTVVLDRPLAVGDVVTVDVNQFKLEQVVESAVPSNNNLFGNQTVQCVNDCSLYVSSPFADVEDRVESGKVEFFINQARVYGVIVGSTIDPTLSPGDTIRINNFYVEHTAPVDGRTAIEQLVHNINQSGVPNAVATVNAGRLMLSVKNTQSAVPLEKLQISAGTGTLFADLGLAVYAHQQTITAPETQDFAHFGQSLFISDNTVTLLVGAPDAAARRFISFDRGTTIFDADSTIYTDTVQQSGVVYSYDYLPSAVESVTNPGQYVFGQQIISDDPTTGDKFGSSVDYTTGTLLIGSPACTVDTLPDAGCVLSLRNVNQIPAWQQTRLQQPAVNSELLNTVFLYNRGNNVPSRYLDYFNPLQGRLLGAVAQNIDYIGSVDPAAYNFGTVNNYGSAWRQQHVGEIWWNTSRVRFLDTAQNDIVYASRRWGQLFPGSQVEMYQWVISAVPPAEYAGPGRPLSLNSFVVSSALNEQGIFSTEYFFWVSGIDTVSAAAKKTLSVETLIRYIENPRASGISYIAPIDSSTIAIYNSLEYITSQDTVLHIEYDQLLNDSAVHSEYQLVAENRADGFLSNDLYQKLQDSLCGINNTGGLVPDIFLSASEKFGVEFRPRQSMFVNRFAALENYLSRANSVLKQFPIAETKKFNLLNSSEPEPSSFSSAWDMRVASHEELTFQNLAEVSIGYRYLVASDVNYQGLWTIYQVSAGTAPGTRQVLLSRVQNYDTSLYWAFVDWYRPGFNPSTRISLEVPVFSSLVALDVAEGTTVKVSANSQGQWELYQLTNSEWQRVGLQGGTIEFLSRLWNYAAGRYGFDVEVFDAQFFDQEPVVETRKIIQAINQELLIDDLAIERNRLLILMFNYILSEQSAPEWLTKTSLIDVDHTVRQLIPYQSYRRDNQEFVADYINEVKPYHTQIREFNLIYKGQDTYLGSTSDFDLPAFWDNEQGIFVSPVLDPTGTLSTTSSLPSTAAVWQDFPWNQWFENYLLSIESVLIVNGGIDYTVPPQVVVTGAAVRAAQMIARVNSQGQVSAIEIVDPGQGYASTAAITLTGGNGTGAQAVAVMGNQVVRSMSTTIKYDRYQYTTAVTPWQSGQEYVSGTLVRHADRVWSANAAIENIEFDPDQWTVVAAGDLSGVDRTMGYYVPRVNEPGLDLALLISGIDYPGVQVAAPSFNFNPGFDSGAFEDPGFIVESSQDPLYLSGVRNVTWSAQSPDFVPDQEFTPDQWVADRYTGGAGFDVASYDNIAFGPEGRPTYDPAILDAIYESNFADTFLGTRPADINVDGGEFVDTFSSHAPEELIPGAIFDTLDMRVFTTPGADWSGDGHGFPSATRKFVYGSQTSLEFGSLLDYPATVQVWNQTRRVQLIPGQGYNINWATLTIQVVDATGANTNDIIVVTSRGVGGGNQLFKQSYNGAEIGKSVFMPMTFSLITQTVVFVNGVLVENYGIFSENAGTLLQFDRTLGADDFATIVLVSDSPIIIPTIERFDSVPFDSAIETAGAGSFDFTGLAATGEILALGWSSPVTEYFVAGNSLTYQLSNSMAGTNPANIVVERNGVRARPAEGAEYTGNGSTVEFSLPTRGGYNQEDIIDTEVAVYVNNTALVLNTDYTVSAVDSSSDRSVVLVQAPAVNASVLISVSTAAQYTVSGNILTWNAVGSLIPVNGDIVSVTTWNDTSEQGIVTKVFQGSTAQGVVVTQGYSETVFDAGGLSGQPGSFDYSAGSVIATNRFDLGRTVVRTDRLLVTLDGNYLFKNVGYTVEGTALIISGAVINPSQVLAVTVFTDSTVPDAIAFRIFQDMRGLQLNYRITESTTTALTQSLAATADTIHVADAARLSQPDLTKGIFGFVTVGNERISYRERSLENNTVSGLRRGTAGTGAATHAAGTAVYDIGIVNLLPAEYQNSVAQEDFLGNGSTTQFNTQIRLDSDDSTELVHAIEVYVAGIRQLPGSYTVDSADPVVVTFAVAPPAGYQVSIVVRQSIGWYAPGTGIALQDQSTPAARFIQGTGGGSGAIVGSTSSSTGSSIGSGY